MPKAKNTSTPAPDTHPSYDAALAELQEIVRNLESDSSGIDQLAEQVKRASELLAFCRAKLRQTETEIEKNW
jgi:exodeoxyribonuclease VII small subunit